MEKELKPFDEILVRNSNKGYWIPALYGFKSKDMKHHLTSAGWQDECIPYEGNEEYLGTNKDYVCPEIVESEDEKIRKAIIEFLKKASGGFLDTTIHCKIFGKWTAWLEKQGELKEEVEDIFPELKGSEDFRIRRELLSFLNERCEDYFIPTSWFSWLKKQGDKDKLIKELGEYKVKYTQEVLSQQLEKQGEQKPTWSEEDEKTLSGLIISLARIGASTRTDSTSVNYTFAKEIDWLKSIKDRVRPQQDWGEDDKSMLDEIIRDLVMLKHRDTGDAGKAAYQKEIDWLKTLKDRYTWKPSEGQMENLSRAFNGGVYRASLLMELYQDLKKLTD